MKTDTAIDQFLKAKIEARLNRIKAMFSPGTTIFGANLMVVSGFLALMLFNPSPDPTPPALVPTRYPEDRLILIDSVHIRPTNTPLSRSFINPTPTPSPAALSPQASLDDPSGPLPEEVFIEGISGHRQSMPLSCEARSAVDWAAYFGKSINEYTFFNGLEIHTNPDKGFVGDVYGSWGQIPPNPYGVHAKPIAQRLREFDLKAKGVYGMTFQDLKTEIASGQPVIVWVIGHVNLGTPVPYTAPGGAQTVVAKFEHTVVVIGYTENKVIILDGARVYTKYNGEFKKSWGVLGNQAVIWLD
jgi:uncharacterized protein YvpB